MPAFEGVRRPLGVICRCTRRTFTSQDVQPPAATFVAATGGPLSCELRPCKVWTCRVARREAGHRDPPQRTEGPAHCGSWVPRHSPSSVSTPFGLCLHRPKGGVICNKISPETTHQLEIRAAQLAMPAPRVPVLSPHSKSPRSGGQGQHAFLNTHTQISSVPALQVRIPKTGQRTPWPPEAVEGSVSWPFPAAETPALSASIRTRSVFRSVPALLLHLLTPSHPQPPAVRSLAVIEGPPDSPGRPSASRSAA